MIRPVLETDRPGDGPWHFRRLAGLIVVGALPGRWIRRAVLGLFAVLFLGMPVVAKDVAAPKPGGMSLDEAKTWWAFQPLPALEKELSPQQIDALIAERLASKSLKPGSPADKRSLIRRATYDLTGLPPTPEQVEAFVANKSPGAFGKVIERLLGSPQYGVRWGRHWLDVVRYADTAGENTDRPLPHAWRYRNWVMDAFNRDLPYDRFVRMQLAGDLLPADRNKQTFREGIIATGYLAIARRFGHDIDKDVHLMHEDVIDNLGKNFLGLSLGCARCHDHKYDPISSRDYYALYGIFNSTRFAYPGCEAKGQPRGMVPLMTAAEVDAVMAPWRKQAAKAKAEKKRRMEAVGAAKKALGEAASRSTRLLAEAKVGEGASVAFAKPVGGPLKPVAVRAGETLQLTVLPNGNHGADSTLVEWVIREVGETGRRWAVADLVQDLTQSNPHPGRGKDVWCFLEVDRGLIFLPDKKVSIRGNSALRAWSHGSEPSVFVNSSNQQVKVWTTLPAESFFVHPGPKNPVAVAWVSPINGTVAITGRVADAHPSGGDGVSFRLEHIAAPEVGPALVAMGKTLGKGSIEVGAEPAIPVAYAVAEAKPKHARVQLRGEPSESGDEVPRRWLKVFGGDPVAKDAGSGRKQLGDWVAGHPIAARVMVNRIWQRHFGQGLVRSPNDFGSRGERATHPKLIDTLASQFVSNGYRIKSIHRLIMQTQVYQRSSAESDTMMQADPGNRLLARFSRRRLNAEEIRDSLLMASGRLDRTPAESHPFPPEKSWKYTQHNPFHAVYPTLKRSAFLMVQRQRRHPFLALFDGADPNASTAVRQVTTVPTQALFFMNDPFYHARAHDVAEAMMKRPDDTARVTGTFQLLFQRNPSAAERERARRFLARYPGKPVEKWAAYARVLLASNEFIYLD